LWRELRRTYGGAGEFLFGEFGIADAMFAPVAIRFDGYGVAADDVATRYMQALFALPAMREWREAGAAEPELVPGTEAFRKPV
jgi:glutathione S-transferase